MARKKTSPGAATGRSNCRSLLIIDSQPIRKKIRREYEKALAAVTDARQQIERFQSHDLPKYNQWYFGLFGALITEIRETARRFSEVHETLLEIEEEMFFGGTSPGAAYRRVMKRKKAEEVEEQSWAEAEEETSKEQNNDREPDPEEEFFKDFFQSIQPEPPPKKKTSADLKALYRELVRRLHPDKHKTSSPRHLEWWHQVQAAYETEDAEQLEAILTLCIIEEEGTTEKATLSVLQRITEQFRKTLRQLRQQLSKHKKDPAWEFSKRDDLDPTARGIRRQLSGKLASLRAELERMELQLKAWEAESQRTRTRSAPRMPRYTRKRAAGVEPLD